VKRSAKFPLLSCLCSLVIRISSLSFSSEESHRRRRSFCAAISAAVNNGEFGELSEDDFESNKSDEGWGEDSMRRRMPSYFSRKTRQIDKFQHSFVVNGLIDKIDMHKQCDWESYNKNHDFDNYRTISRLRQLTSNRERLVLPLGE